MPRARNIKPGFFENEHLGPLPGDIQLLFIALWTLADKEGVVECRISKIRKYVFGFRDDVTDDKLNGYITVLERLDNGRMLGRVFYEGQDYLIIKNFTIHQHPHHTEKKGGLPDIELLEAAESANNGYATVTKQVHNGYTPSDLLIPDSLIPDSREQPKQDKKVITKLEELSVDHVKDWLAKKRKEGKYLNHDENQVLEVFKNYCQAKGKKYVDYVAAYRNAFDWDRFNGKHVPQKKARPKKEDAESWINAGVK